MGSVTSTPKLPKTQQPLIINMPATSYVPPASSPATNNNTNTDTNGGTTPNASTPTREENLLTRSRGVLGTVLTSLRGVLADTSSKSTARKTLLGE